MKKLLLVLFTLSPFLLMAQQTLTLTECYTLAEKNYPLAKQSDLLKDKTGSEIKAIKKEQYPKLDLNAQATYQSEVIQFPVQLPNVTIERPNKDQYRATLDASQLIYNGGNIAATTKLKEAELKTQQQQVAVNLYQLKTRINQYYFSVLLFQKQDELLQETKQQLQSRLDEVKAGIKFGALLAASGEVLEAELLIIQQQITQNVFDKINALENLSSLLSFNIDTNVTLVNPETIPVIENASERPELKLFNLQQQQIETAKTVISKEKFPKISGFAQAGYGNPGLNMLDNSFQDFYMAGIKLHWNIFDWGKTKDKNVALSLSQELINTEKETFILNNEMQINVLENDRNKYDEMIKTDTQIIELREKVMLAVSSQLKNGVITTSQYLTDFNKLYEAKTEQQLHEIQLALIMANYRVLKGISE
jgi:outer membrane protein TolC